MEKLKKKHDHHATKCLQITLFFIVMLAPFIAVLVECLSIIQNEQMIAAYTGQPINVFYDAVERLSSENLFSWTSSTSIYSTLNLMLTGLDLGTGTATLCLLLTYWALMSAIYIVFDIIIFIFTKITHMIQ